jgi:hypothetical protein
MLKIRVKFTEVISLNISQEIQAILYRILQEEEIMVQYLRQELIMH